MSWDEIAKGLVLLSGLFAIVALFLLALTWAMPS